MALYCTVQEFKDSAWFVGLEDFFLDNAQISGFLEDVCGLIDNYCGRTFTTGSYTEEFVGTDSGSFFLPVFPLLSIESITYQSFNTVPDYGTVVDTTSSSGSISTGSIVFTREGLVKSNIALTSNRIYTVTYTAGYNTIPQPIKTATMQLAKILADSTDTGNLAWADGATVSQFKFGKFTETYTTNTNRSTMAADNLPPTIALLLRRYRYSKSI